MSILLILILILLITWIIFKYSCSYPMRALNQSHNSFIFIDKRLHVNESNLPNSGYGVFTNEFIPKDTIIERAHCISIPVDERDGITTILKYDFTCFDDSTKTLVAMGFGGIYNHNNQYNVNWTSCGETNTIVYITNRDIYPNEELFVDYGSEYFNFHGMIDTSK